jgi:hypothetical protein
MKYYKYGSVVIAALCCLTTLHKYGGRSHKYLNLIMYENAGAAAIMTCYMIFAITSCAYSYRMTTRPGMSSELRTTFILRHMLYVLVYILVWLPYLGLCFFVVYACVIENEIPGETPFALKEELIQQTKKWWDYNNMTTVFTGLLMGIIRITEPSFMNVIKSYIMCRRSSFKPGNS